MHQFINYHKHTHTHLSKQTNKPHFQIHTFTWYRCEIKGGPYDITIKCTHTHTHTHTHTLRARLVWLHQSTQTGPGPAHTGSTWQLNTSQRWIIPQNEHRCPGSRCNVFVSWRPLCCCCCCRRCCCRLQAEEIGSKRLLRYLERHPADLSRDSWLLLRTHSLDTVMMLGLLSPPGFFSLCRTVFGVLAAPARRHNNRRSAELILRSQRRLVSAAAGRRRALLSGHSPVWAEGSGGGAHLTGRIVMCVYMSFSFLLHFLLHWIST